MSGPQCLHPAIGWEWIFAPSRNPTARFLPLPFVVGGDVSRVLLR